MRTIDDRFEAMIGSESPEAQELARVAFYQREPRSYYNKLPLHEIDRILTLVKEYEESARKTR